MCVEILGRVLQALEPIQLAQSYKMVLQSGLNHPNDSVRLLTLTQVSAEGAERSSLSTSPAAFRSRRVFLFQIGRVAGHADGVTQMLNSAEILRDVIQCITVERIAVAKEVLRPTLHCKTTFFFCMRCIKVSIFPLIWLCCVFGQAIAALSKLSNTKAGLDALFRSDFLNKLKDVMLTNDIIRYRVYEVRGHLWMEIICGFKRNHVCSAVCVCAVDSGGVRSVSSVSGLLRQQWFNLTDAGGTDRR